MIARLFFLLALALVVSRPNTASAAALTNTPGHRFVFLVDASALMEPARKATEKTIEELIASGARGQMQAGDAFVIWPYRLRVVNDAFEPTVWLPNQAVALAKTSGDFLRNLKYEGAGLFYVALVETFRVIKASPSVTVFLISDGAEMLQGTPFDLYANTIYRQRATQLRKEKKPFVTALLALDGNVIDCTVGVGGEPLTVPAVPPEARPKPAPAPATVPEPVITTAKPAPAPVAATTVTPAPAPTTPAPKQTTTTKATTEPKTAAVVEPRPASTPAAKTAPAPAAIVVTPAPPVVTAPPPPAPAVTKAPEPAPVSTPPPTPAPEPVPTKAATTVEASPKQAEPENEQPPTKKLQLATLVVENRLLVIGVGLLLVAGLIGFILVQRRRAGRAHASLITQSMKR
jgi:hypothetical protein